MLCFISERLYHVFMIKNIFTVLVIGFICSFNLYGDDNPQEVTKIKRSTVVKKLNEQVENAKDYVSSEYVSLINEFDDVLEEIIDEAEFEDYEYKRNQLKAKFEMELGNSEIAVEGGMGVERNAWGGGRTYTIFKSINARESSAFVPVIKFSIKLYDAYIKNGYTQLDALKEMQKSYQMFTAERAEIVKKEKAEEEKKEKKKSKSTQRNVPSRWRSYR